MSETNTSVDAARQYTTDVVETTGVYADQEYAEEQNRVLQSHKGDSADDVDPRKLSTTPSISELRWYYRREIGQVLVEKPVRDIFKNGFDVDVRSDSEEVATEVTKTFEQPNYHNGEGGGNFIDAYMSAHIKARRDGFALIYLVVKDDAAGPHISPLSDDVTVDSDNPVTKVKVWPIDRLSSTAGQAHDQIQEAYDIERDEYEIRKTGIVVDSRVEEPTYREPLGYVVDSTPPRFVHKDRVQHYTWNTNVDHNYDSNDTISRYGENLDTLGEWEGDSVLLSSYNLTKGISKGNWAVMQALFRNAAHLYTVKVPQNVAEEEYRAADDATRNINAKSSLTFPSTDYDVEQHASGNEMDPTDFYDAIFDQLCAVHEMTRSVLFGTQSGTVSGSETDIKNYFNKVERLRSERVENELLSYAAHVKRMKDGRTKDAFDYDDVFIDWGPLFQVDRETKINMWQTAAQSVTTLIGQYALDPDEARALLSEEFVDIELDELSEEQMDVLDRIRLGASGQGPQALASEREYTEGPPNQQTVTGESGRPEGAQQSSENSGASPSTDSLTDELERIVTLYDDGMLTDDEFETLKSDIISGD